MADGHAKNNLVAFWREIPEGWVPKPGMDPRFADSIRIPLAQSFSNQFRKRTFPTPVQVILWL